jgi:uncharacterized protein involved in type VI secretion and phage assembly
MPLPDRDPDAVYGFHLGIVGDNDDPQKLGRLRLTVPAVLGEDELWAMPCVPFAGAGRGFHSLPHAGDLVWVVFHAGDTTRPVWVGSRWRENDLPADTGPDVTLIKTAKATIRIDDATGEIVIENEGGARITLTSTEITVSAGGVTVEASGRTIDLAAASVSVNSGALEVS